MADGMKFAKSHEWIRKESGNVYAVGISDFAQQEIRDIVFIDLPKVGREARQGMPVGSIESVKAAFEIYSPVSGKVVAVNEKAAQDVTVVHKDAQGAGWLFKIEPSNPAEFSQLLDEEQYKHHAASGAH